MRRNRSPKQFAKDRASAKAARRARRIRRLRLRKAAAVR